MTPPPGLLGKACAPTFIALVVVIAAAVGVLAWYSPAVLYGLFIVAIVLVVVRWLWWRWDRQAHPR